MKTMGTNYYVKLRDDDVSGMFNELHVGKSSCGWYFALRTYPDKGINELDDWIKIFNNPHLKIVDENGSVVEPEDMVKIIVQRRGTLEMKGAQETSDYVHWCDKYNLHYVSIKFGDYYNDTIPSATGKPYCLTSAEFS